MDSQTGAADFFVKRGGCTRRGTQDIRVDRSGLAEADVKRFGFAQEEQGTGLA